ALADEVLALVAAHRAQTADAGDDLEGAVGALPVAGATDRPEVAGTLGGVHHAVAGRSLDFDPERFDAHAGHASMVHGGRSDAAPTAPILRRYTAPMTIRSRLVLDELARHRVQF